MNKQNQEQQQRQGHKLMNITRELTCVQCNAMECALSALICIGTCNIWFKNSAILSDVFEQNLAAKR